MMLEQEKMDKLSEISTLEDMQKQLVEMTNLFNSKKRQQYTLTMAVLMFAIILFATLFWVLIRENLYVPNGLYNHVLIGFVLVLTVLFFIYSTIYKYTITSNRLLLSCDNLILKRKLEIKSIEEREFME